MDTSEQYVKMCEKAEEIQKEWIPSLMDMVSSPSGVEFIQNDAIGALSLETEQEWQESYLYRLTEYYDTNEVRVEKDGLIWLPRQDQLQEMVIPILSKRYQEDERLTSEVRKEAARPWAPAIMVWDLIGQIDDVALDWTGEVNEYYRSMASMEQVWLAFVMKEKHGKTWNGEEWIDQE